MVLRICWALSLTDAFDIDQIDTFTVQMHVTDAVATTPYYTYYTRPKYHSRT